MVGRDSAIRRAERSEFSAREDSNCWGNSNSSGISQGVWLHGGNAVAGAGDSGVCRQRGLRSSRRQAGHNIFGLGEESGQPKAFPERKVRRGCHGRITIAWSTCSLQNQTRPVENVEKQDGITCSGKAIARLSPKSLKLPKWAVKPFCANLA